jgi:hypothetical protein
VHVLPTKSLAAMMKSALPLDTTADTPVRVIRNNAEQQRFPAGVVKLQNENDAVEFFELLGQSPITRLKRQINLLSAWVDALAASPTALAAITGDSPDFVEYLRALATGPSQYRHLPVEEETQFLGLWIIEPNEAETRLLAAQMVPFPVMAEPGARLRTALFNGTTNCDLTLSAATRFVENGAQIGVLGNAKTLDIEESEVVYYDASLETRVRQFAQALGIDAVRKVDGESAVDITVTLGADFKG